MIYTILSSIIVCLIGGYLGFRSTKKQYAQRIEEIERQLKELFDISTKEDLKQVAKLLKETKVRVKSNNK